MAREKYNLIQELQKKSIELQGEKRLSLIGQGDFPGANNVMRGTMNIKHHVQHLTIDNPEFPFLYDGKENIAGKYSSFYFKTDKSYKVINIIKKYDELLKGKCYIALYFLYNKKDDEYIVVERKEAEGLTENFGFSYNNDYLDNAEIGEVIPKDTTLYASTSYDEYGNVSSGVNGRILYAVHPAVQDDAIIVSESFAKRMVANSVTPINITLSDNTILLNLYGDEKHYKGLPDVGDVIDSGIVAATRTIKEARMFSDMRDSSLMITNEQSDQKFYGEGEVIDITIYCNSPDVKPNKVNKQLLQYYKDSRWFYTEVYKQCKEIMHSGAKHIDTEIDHWMKKAQDYLDEDAKWSVVDSVFHGFNVEILIRNKEPLNIGRKIVGRHGNR